MSAVGEVGRHEVPGYKFLLTAGTFGTRPVKLSITRNFCGFEALAHR